MKKYSLVFAWCAGVTISGWAFEAATDARQNPVINNLLPSVQWLFSSPVNAALAPAWPASNRMTVVDAAAQGIAASAIASGDVDRNSSLDLVIAATSGTNLYLPSRVTWYSQPNPCAIALGDLNNDGRLDMVLGYFGGTNQVYINVAGGTNFTQYALPSLVLNTRAVIIGDFNRDGWLDILEVNDEAQGTIMHLNDGTGTNWANTGSAIGPSQDGRAAAVGDFNNDQFNDIVVASGNGWPSYVYINTGSGTNYTALQLGVPRNARGVAVNDLNRDGRPDIVQVNAIGDPDCVYIAGAGGTNFTEYSAAFADSSSDNSSSVAAHDINADGYPDVIVGVNAAQESVAYCNNGTGVQFTRTLVAGVSNVVAVTLEDWQNAGMNDIVCVQAGGNVTVNNNELAALSNTVLQARYRVTLDDVGDMSRRQVWASEYATGAYHGIWNSGLIVSNVTHSSDYAWRLQCVDTQGATGAWSNLRYFTFRLSNDYCEFVRTPQLQYVGASGSGHAVEDLVMRGVASPTIMQAYLTNTVTRWSLPLTPAATWAVSNIPNAFLAADSNYVHAVGITASGKIATDGIVVIVTNRGIVLVSPQNHTWTNVPSVTLLWQVPSYVTDPNWVRLRWNSTNWIAPTSLTGTTVTLPFITNEGRVAYTVPGGATETSGVWFVYAETNPPLAELVYPSNGGILTTSNVVFQYMVYDPAVATISNQSPASGIGSVWIMFWRGASTFTTSLYGWADSTNIISTYATFPLNPLSDGDAYAWQVRVWDRAGNMTTSAVNRFSVHANVITLQTPVQDTWLNSVQCEFSWLVPAYFVPDTGAWARININNTAWTDANTLTSAVRAVLLGTNVWQVMAGTSAGLILTSTVGRFMIDTTPPTASLLHPAAGKYVQKGNVMFNYQVSDTNSIWRSGVRQVRFHFIDPSNDFRVGLSDWAEAPITNVYATFPYNPFTRETDLIYAWQLELSDIAGNVTTTDYAWFGVDSTPPTIAVLEPYAGATFTTNIRAFVITGVAADTHGDLSIIRWANQTAASSGVATGLSAWTTLATNMTLIEGTNTLVFTAYDTAGNFTSDTMLAVLDLSPPLISFTYPAGGELLLADGYDFDLQGIIRDIYAPVVESTWSNLESVTHGDLTLVSNAWSVPGVLLALPYGVTNTILVAARDIYGWSTSATVKIVLVAGTNTIPILANWPQQIGLAQTGFLEIATSSNEEYTLRLGPDPGIELAAWRATSDYSMVAFTYAHQGLVAGDTPLLRLISLSNGNFATMPRPFTLVSEWALDATGKTPLREDGDEVYCRIHAKPQPAITIQGKSIFIRGLIAPAKIFVRVTSKMGGNGHTAIPYIEADGVIQSIKTKGCSIDEIHAAGGVRSIQIDGGSLGYRHDKRAQVCHGLACGDNALSVGLRDVKVTTWRGGYGEILGRILAPASFNGKGVKLIAAEGTIEGVFMADTFDELVAYAIEDSWVYATNVGLKGYAIDSIKAAYLRDSGLTGTTNTYLAQQIFVAGMDPGAFWRSAHASNSFAGIVPQGVIRRVSGKPGCVQSHGVYIIGTPTKPIVVPNAVDRQKEYWFINGNQAPTPWNGKTIP